MSSSAAVPATTAGRSAVLSPPAPTTPDAGETGSDAGQAASRPPLRRRPMSPVRRRRTIREGLLFCLLILPNLAAILVFSYWPAIYNIVLSFMDWDLVAPMPEWVGLENYIDLFTDPEFWSVMLNTLVFTTVTVVGSLVGGVLLGTLLATKVPFTGMVRTFAFAPHMLPGAAVGMLWLFMFDPSFGLSRFLFNLVGMESPQWTTTSDWSLAAVTVAYLWQRLGFVTVIYYTAILDLPKDILEAASLDGAHGVTMLRHMVLPLLSPITFFLSVTGVIAAAQAFDLISILTNGGPGISSSTLSWMIYEEAFQKFDIGKASSAATVLLVLLLVLTFMQVRFGEKKVNYAS
ncbi:carbohydrate ABC transporter permease [Brachybacterium sp. NPDC056505]|uniref:carbohydrate ABC transporter permease n=1 Tax=Brachybacterium sp. NPDC056505 TaxID=3345843 RepID=UPI00366FD877